MPRAALTFTAKGTKSPARARPTWSAMVSPALSCASSVLAPRCGVTTTPGSPNNGESVHGSVENTSSAAPPTWPCSIAVGQRGFVDDAAARHVDDADARLGLGQQLGVDQAHGLGGLGHVEGDEVGHGHQLVEVDELDVDLAGPLGRDERVEGDEPHAEGEGPLRDELADAAEADDAERLVAQLDAGPPRALPPALDQCRVGLGDVAGLGEQQRHRVLRGRQHVRLGRVDHHHAALGGRGDVDVVEPDAGAADDDQLGAGFEDLGGDLVEDRMISALAVATRSEELVG